MARKETSLPIFDEDEPVGKGRAIRAVNKLVRDWLVESQERPLRILTTGQEGIGPVLVRSLGLFGSNNGTEFTSMAQQEEDGNTPPIVTAYKWKEHDIVDVTVFDTPGLHDDSVDEADAVAQMVRKIGSHIDVFLFCCKLHPSSRVSKVEERMVSRLTRAFGESLWQKAVLVFSFAGYEEMVKIDHKRLIAVHEDGLHGCIRRAAVPQNVIMEIPLCIAGNPDQILKKVLRRAAPNATPSLLMLKWRPDAAVRAVELRPLVEGLTGGLGCEMAEAGSNFSVGQRQLVCLARALLRKNKILVLDEATANVDLKTDAIIQQTLREKFTHCTVLTIAHRLITVMDSDRIMVLDSGRLREFDSLHRLLQRPQGLLSLLVNQTGSSEGARLRQAALEAHWGHNRLEDECPAQEGGLPVPAPPVLPSSLAPPPMT